LEISKIFSLSAAAAVFFWEKSAAAVFFWEKSAAAAVQPIGLHL
jgi:hypothetical protein